MNFSKIYMLTESLLKKEQQKRETLVAYSALGAIAGICVTGVLQRKHSPAGRIAALATGIYSVYSMSQLDEGELAVIADNDLSPEIMGVTAGVTTFAVGCIADLVFNTVQ